MRPEIRRVLIHAAFGGVGLAAVQLAGALGASVAATAGTAGKRALLRSNGQRNIASSRDLGFVGDCIMVRACPSLRCSFAVRKHLLRAHEYRKKQTMLQRLHSKPRTLYNMLPNTLS